MDEATKAKIAAAMTGRTDSDETREKKRLGRLGKTHTPEAKAKIRAARMAQSPEERAEQARSFGMLGKKLTPDQRARMSEAQRKRHAATPPTQETRAKIAAARRTPLAERFFTYADCTGDCWLWRGSVKNSGYGMAYIGMQDGRAIYRTAHRTAYELAHGPIPAGMLVLHACDTKLCVRPEHLRLGTQSENMRDMAAKGRQWKQRRHADAS